MLNESQKKAVFTKEPFLFLLAGAGTGKTRVIVERIKHLMNEGIKAEEILAITFTRRATLEMKKRINLENVAVHTFHQFCYSKLKENIDYKYKMIDKTVQISEEEQLKITRYKNSFYKDIKPKVYDDYQMCLKQNNMKDFDDLLIDFHHYFHKIRKQINFKYIFIDEFQDTNLLQYMIIQKLAVKNIHIFCVGDPDQSIYKFRGAQTKIIDMFVKDYHAAVFQLTSNYRSTKNIIMLANSLIKQNNRTYKKSLITSNHVVGSHKILVFKNQREEALSIIEFVKLHRKNGVNLADIAVLFRSHERSFLCREICDQMGIMYRSESSERMAEDKLNLLTLHQSKGLEFSVVFIIGLENGSLPSYHAKTQQELEEERRLFFVGITRAKKHLYITSVRFNNEARHLKKSIFLKGLNR